MIRLAKEADIDAIIDMGEGFWAQTFYAAHAPYDRESMRLTCRDMLSHEFSAKMPLLWVIELDSLVVGALGLAAAALYANNSVRYLAEMFWFVREEHRGAGHGTALFDAVQSAAEGAGYTFMSMMLLESVEADRAAGIYRQLGFVQAERTFLKVLAT